MFKSQILLYDRQPGILCNICNLWVHRLRAGSSKKEYEDLQNSDNDETCFCRPVKINFFPFFELTNNQLINLHENIKTRNKNKDYNTFCKSQKISVVCSVCDKRNSRANTGVFCRNCKVRCHKTTNFVLESEKYIFNYKVNSEKTDKPHSSHVDYSDMMTDNFILQPKFKFYQIHEFHKLVNNLSENKTFSVFHTNIGSLQANFDNLQNLINKLV